MEGAAAVALRVAGASFADIATTLGLSSPRRALQVVEQELADRVTDADVDVQRAEASARLEALMASVWPKASNPDDPEHLPAVKTAVGIVDRHIRLHGLDRPSEVIVHTPTSQELETWVAAMASIGVPEVVEADIVGQIGIGDTP